MSQIARLVAQTARKTGTLFRRADTRVANRYRTGSDELRNAATGLTNADRHGDSKIRWDGVKYALALGGGITAGLMLSQYVRGDSAEQETPPRSNHGPVQEVDALIRMSPTLSKTLQDLEADGWIIRWGPKGSGYWTSREQKVINMQIDAKGSDIRSLTRVLAHEIGHAYKGAAIPPPVTPPREGMTREQWIKEQMHYRFEDEAEGALMAMQVRHEILDNGGPDIGGVEDKIGVAADYAYVYYRSGYISRQEARLAVANILDNDPQGGWYQYYYPTYRSLSNEYFSN